MSKNSNYEKQARGTVHLRCPACRREYDRIYKDYDSGFGYCTNADCVEIKLVKVSVRELSEEKLEKIKAELSGKIVHRSSSGRVIA